MSAPLSEQHLAEMTDHAEAWEGHILGAWENRFPLAKGLDTAVVKLAREVKAATAEVERLAAHVAELETARLSPHERLFLRFALDMADEAVASNPADFTEEDTAAMAKLRALSTGPTVAYRNPWRPGVLLCCEHGEGWEGMKPLAVEDLPNGGTCTAGDPANPDDVCGRDVLAEAGDLR